MARFKVRINGTAEYVILSSQELASVVAREIVGKVNGGSPESPESCIQVTWDNVAVLEVIKID